MASTSLASAGPEVEKIGKSLAVIAKGIERDLRDELKGVGELIASGIRASTAYPYLTGETRHSVRVGFRGGVVSLYSNLPQAPVLEFGGTIQPNGVPIRFKESAFVRGPVERKAPEVERWLEKSFESWAARNGFH